MQSMTHLDKAIAMIVCIGIADILSLIGTDFPTLLIICASNDGKPDMTLSIKGWRPNFPDHCI